MAEVEVPSFTWVYALLITVFILAIISFIKPKQDYKPFEISQFDSCGSFCLARVQWWTVRFIFYYVQPLVAGPLFIITIVLISALSAVRLNNNFYDQIDVARGNLNNNNDTCTDLKEYLDATIVWSDQLTWLLTIYFFQKLFGATLFLNGGGLATIASMIFDPWLYFASIWGIILFYEISDLATSNSFDSCINDFLDEENTITALDDVVNDLNSFCIILWILCSLSLPFGILIDYICMVVGEFKYGINGNNNNSTKRKMEAQHEVAAVR